MTTTEPKTREPKAAHSPLLRIMYCSLAHQSWSNEELSQLLTQCQRNNERDGITGVLMLDRKLIVQYVEGPAQATRALWQRVEQDTRHHMIVRLHEKEGRLPRLFGQWAMLHGQVSRAEMLSLIRHAYLQSSKHPRPAWSMAIAPLVILLDNNYRYAHTHSTW